MRSIHSPLLGCVLAVFTWAFSGSVQAQLSDVTQPGDPIIPSSNNSPGSEGVANAIDNQPTKYLNFDRLNTGFTVTPRVGLTVVQCLSLTSANDAPERDPATYRLEGSYDGTNFTLISEGAVPTFTNRFDKVVIRFENNTPYLAYRLIFPEVFGPGGNSMQIAEVELLGFLAPSDVTQPSDPIVPTSNNSPGSEGVANVIDNQPTKYLNFDRLNTGFTVTPSVGGTLVSGISLTSANDAPERDPASYQLEGSLDGTSFFPIASGAVPPFPTRFLKNYIFFPNVRAFRAYRLIFPTVAGPGGNSMQIAEVELLGDVADLAQDVTLPGDPIVGTSNNTPGSEGVPNAIDNQPTKYLNFDRLNTGFTVNPGARGLTVVSGLTLTSANDAPERDPADFTLAGSYDGTNFTPIASGPVPVFTNRFQKVTILFENQVPYAQYRLIFPNVAGPGGNSMQISEVELLGVLADTDVTTPGDPIVGTSNNTPGSEGVANAIDNQPTKYLNFDRLNTGFTVTPRVGGTIVIGLSLTSANDAPERDPADYVLTGSNDGAEFVPISSGTVPPFPARFYKNYIFFPANTKEFTSYRLIFPNVAGPGGNSMQIAEVEFLGHQRGGGSCTIQTNGVLIRRQPQDTPVLLGSTATFHVGRTGPWKVQWFRNGVAIPGANNEAYTTPPAVGTNDGDRYFAKVGPATAGGVRGLCETSDEVMLSIFAPSTTQCIGLSWMGSGANGAPTAMLPTDITGFSPQAYWNNLAGGSGTLPQPLNSSNQAHPTITVTWATSGEWGVGTGSSDPLERMLNGIVTSAGTSEGGAQTVTLSGVPAGNHSLFLYTVQVPQEFFNMDFVVVTHDTGGNDVIQGRFIRPLNSDEYNPSPGFSLVTAETPETRSVGNMMRFDNLQPGPDGIILIRFYSPGRVDLPGGDPIRGPGLNGMQLCLNPAPVGAPPLITQQPASANGIAGGCITLCVQATGPNLTYQWLKNGQEIAGATAPCLTIANLRTNDAGSYTVVVSNPAGRVLSRTAVIDVVPSAQITLGLISYFKLDFGAPDGNTASNSAPGGLNGVIQGFPDFPPGQIGNSLNFNQADNYVVVPNYPKVTKAITVSGWVQSFQWGPLVNNWIEGQTTGSSGQFLVDVVDIGGVFTFRAQIEVGPNRVLATAALNAEQLDSFLWHHFAVSANGVTLSLYWDGQLVGAVDYLGSLNSTPSIPWLSLGANLAGAPPALDPTITPNLYGGLMDDVALWNRSLSGSELRGIYNSGLSGTNLAGTPPVLTVGNCPPTIICPNNILAECAGAAGTIVNFIVTAVDQTGNELLVTCVPPSGSLFTNGQTTVTCTATAAPGNSSSCSFRVTVADTAGPVLTCPTNGTVECTGGLTPVNYNVSATDACQGNVVIVCTPPSGTGFPLGTSNVTCRASDSTGHSNSCSFIVRVVDTMPPTTTCPSNMNVQATSPAGAGVNFVAVASDPCGIATFDCLPTSGGNFPIGITTVTCTATDTSGNSNSCSFTITVRTGNQCPIANPLSLSVTQDSQRSFQLPASDPDGNPLQYSITQLPAHGTVTLQFQTGAGTYTPAAGYCGPDSFAYAASDGICAPVGASVTIDVRCLNDCPTAVIKESSLCQLPGGPPLLIPAGDNDHGCIVLDGTMSSDPGGNPLTYLWYADGAALPFASGPVVTNCFPIGEHTVRLVVDNGHCVGNDTLQFEVITICDSIEQLLHDVNTANLARKNKRPLVASLKSACASFERGNFNAGIQQLMAFQHKLRAQIARDNPAEAARFYAQAQAIIDAAECAQALERTVMDPDHGDDDDNDDDHPGHGHGN